jgi:hypothetical protein
MWRSASPWLGALSDTSRPEPNPARWLSAGTAITTLLPASYSQQVEKKPQA